MWFILIAVAGCSLQTEIGLHLGENGDVDYVDFNQSKSGAILVAMEAAQKRSMNKVII